MWLESHANLARHPKTRRLMKRLGWSLPDTIGNLHLFWYWALDFAPTGDLTPYTPEELTADLDLLGATPDQFIESMVAAGFLDCSESSSSESQDARTLLIHDWIDYKRPRKRLAANSHRPSHEGRNPSLPVPPRRDPEPAPISASRAPDQPSLDFRVQDAALPAESTRPAMAGQTPDLEVPPRRDALAHLNTQPHKLHPSATGEPSSEDAAPTADSDSNSTQTPIENDFRTELPANLWRLPGFAKHWWPLYLDFYKKSGTPLNADARAKFLAQLAKDPLTAVQQIKVAITKTVRSNFADPAMAGPRTFTRLASRTDAGGPSP